ncbi:uncharacterized protein N7477_008387 [Penicillium maclennaniae]|uniref:uncharacterized protein n=1 Tax=Penicillium maclennaniae TaxID=1343394 RepID=UPI0025405C46|nr:uncharacterized protein N7477_008387 [Penicillium maclennaniae]KAJ5665939.1 hypothetical protein N7477_008387 [Penicillium maclennaniae]
MGVDQGVGPKAMRSWPATRADATAAEPRVRALPLDGIVKSLGTGDAIEQMEPQSSYNFGAC